MQLDELADSCQVPVGVADALVDDGLWKALSQERS
jgi:hypothetical protein